ncbi:hypothetical protein S245_055904, partial [Arachis hypogaea]
GEKGPNKTSALGVKKKNPKTPHYIKRERERKRERKKLRRECKAARTHRDPLKKEKRKTFSSSHLFLYTFLILLSFCYLFLLLFASVSAFCQMRCCSVLF